MLTAYINQAMRQAHYELMENGRFFGSIKACQGAWAEAATLEECRAELQEVLEDWLLIKLRFGDEIPVVDGINLNTDPTAEPEYAEAD
jgi:predicted RNase H-like HicB family nuclease